MNHYRIAPPEKNIQEEAESLFERFLNQYKDGEEIPESAYDEYLRKFGSKELVQYLDEVNEGHESAEREGYML